MRIDKKDCDIELRVEAIYRKPIFTAPNGTKIKAEPQTKIMARALITNELRKSAKIKDLEIIEMEFNIKVKDLIDYIIKNKWLEGSLEVCEE